MTKTRPPFGAFLGTLVLSIAVSSYAKELREPQAHMLVDVPDDWQVNVDGRYQRAEPPDHTFHLRLVASDHGMRGEDEAEKYLLDVLREKFQNIQIDRHARRSDWGAFHSYEIWGHGVEEGGGPGKFFIELVTDARNERHGLVILGTGPNDGFDRHQRGIYDATHRIRVW